MMLRGCTRSTRRICIECNNLSNGWETRATVRCILINNTGSYYTTLRIPLFPCRRERDKLWLTMRNEYGSIRLERILFDSRPIPIIRDGRVTAGIPNADCYLEHRGYIPREQKRREEKRGEEKKRKRRRRWKKVWKNENIDRLAITTEPV